jgi:hypothetical protein
VKKILKSYKFRIYPTKEQESLLSKHFGACRFVFNRYLNSRKETYLEEKKSLNYYDNANDLTKLKKEEEFVGFTQLLLTPVTYVKEEYRNNGIGYNLMVLLRKNYPLVVVGPVVESTYNNLIKFYNEYLAK